MAIIEAYFDESGTHEGSPDICIAGYLFEKGNAIALDAACAIDLVRTYATHGFAASVAINDFHLIPKYSLLNQRIRLLVCRCF